MFSEQILLAISGLYSTVDWLFMYSYSSANERDWAIIESMKQGCVRKNVLGWWDGARFVEHRREQKQCRYFVALTPTLTAQLANTILDLVTFFNNPCFRPAYIHTDFGKYLALLNDKNEASSAHKKRSHGK